MRQASKRGKTLLIWAFALLIVLGGCRQYHSKHQSVKQENISLKHWLAKIDAGDLANLQGLFTETGLDDIRKAIEPEGQLQPYALGSEKLQGYSIAFTHQTQPLQVFADSFGKVVLLRLEDAILTQSAKELAELWGEPDVKRELPSDHQFAPSQLWIFPNRGVALYVLDPQKRGSLSLSAIAIFAPGISSETYFRELDGDERIRMSRD